MPAPALPSAPLLYFQVLSSSGCIACRNRPTDRASPITDPPSPLLLPDPDLATATDPLSLLSSSQILIRLVGKDGTGEFMEHHEGSEEIYQQACCFPAVIFYIHAFL